MIKEVIEKCIKDLLFELFAKPVSDDYCSKMK